MTDPNRSEMNVPDNDRPEGEVPASAPTPIEGGEGHSGAPAAEEGHAATPASPSVQSDAADAGAVEPGAVSSSGAASFMPPPWTQEELPAPPEMEELAAPPADGVPLEIDAAPISETAPISDSPPSEPPMPAPSAGAPSGGIDLGKAAGEGAADAGPAPGFGAAEPPPERMTPQVVTPRDPNTAFLLELILGLFGILGIGYLYIGRNEDGLIRLIGWLVYMFVAWGVIVALSIVVVGLCLIPFQIAIQIGVPVWSAIYLRKQLESGEI